MKRDSNASYPPVADIQNDRAASPLAGGWRQGIELPDYDPLIPANAGTQME